MKSIIKPVLVLGMVLSFSQCQEFVSGEKTEPGLPNDVIVDLTFQAGTPTKSVVADSKNTISFTWESSDQLIVYSNKGYVGKMELIDGGGTSTATFRNRLKIPAGTNELRFFHFGTDVEVNETTHVAFMSFANQDGQLGSFQKNIVSRYTIEYLTPESVIGGNLVPVIALGKFDVSGVNPSSVAQTATMYGITSNELTVDNCGVVTFRPANTTNLTNVSSSSTSYFVILAPESDVESLWFRGTRRAQKQLSGRSIEAGIYYTKNDNGDPIELVTDVFEWVDFGTGVLWGSSNVGADYPDKVGDYFAFGEISSKDSYSWSNYKYGTSASSLSKYYLEDGLCLLDASDDAATVALNEGRTPCFDEWQALMDHTTWTWLNAGETSPSLPEFTPTINGYLVVGKDEYSSSHIFIPAAGYKDNADIQGEKSIGAYLSCNRDEKTNGQFFSCNFTNSSINAKKSEQRSVGFSVRPVKDIDDGTIIDLGTSVVWRKANIGGSINTDYGDYYAWGELTTKDKYDIDNYTGKGSDLNYDLPLSRDIVNKTLGATWRMPTKDEFNAIINACVQQWTDNYNSSGIPGYIFFKKKETGMYSLNDPHMFLPASGFIFGEVNYTKNEIGYYWTRTKAETRAEEPPRQPDLDAYYYTFSKVDTKYVEPDYRFYGRSVKGVRRK